jgi:hypothetical protein
VLCNVAGDSWERVFCVLYKRWLVFYAHKDDTEPVLRVKLKHVKHATFYRNISSLMLFDRYIPASLRAHTTHAATRI